jgi:hypothetical protein
VDRSKTEELIGILWLILAFTASDKSAVVTILSAILGLLALILAIVFAWKDRSQYNKVSRPV